MKTPYFQGEDKSIFEAVWQYILDHSDIKSDGMLFVKFYVKDKKSFSQKIASRMKGVFRDGWKENIMSERRYKTLAQADMDRAISDLQNEILPSSKEHEVQKNKPDS